MTAALRRPDGRLRLPYRPSGRCAPSGLVSNRRLTTHGYVSRAKNHDERGRPVTTRFRRKPAVRCQQRSLRSVDSFGAGLLRFGFRRTSSAHVVLSRLPVGWKGSGGAVLGQYVVALSAAVPRKRCSGRSARDEDTPSADGMDGKRMADSDGVSTLRYRCRGYLQRTDHVVENPSRCLSSTPASNRSEM